MSASDPAVEIEVWSDVACPWCWVGKRNLEAATRGLETPVRVAWRAFELDPAAPPSPPEAADYVGRIAKKYGVPRAHAEGTLARLCDAGSEAGIEFRFDRIKPGNTFDAHRLLHLASLRGRQNELKEELFQAYFVHGAPISDRGVLAETALAVGLDDDEIRRVLDSDTYTHEVRRDENRAHKLGIGGVPCFVFGRRYALSGAQPPTLLRQALERCWSERDPGSAAAPSA